jgi:hypothetical protein
MIKVFLSVVWSVVIVSVFIQPTNQQDTAKGYILVEANANACELNRAILEQLAYLANREGDNVIIIARLGIKEKSPNLSKRRLMSAKLKLEHYLSSERIITAQSESISSQARLEFYLKGKLFLVSLVQHNKDICVDC